jgi:hypothetical protein
MVPFLVGMLAAGVWLRRRQAFRGALSAAPDVPRIGAAPGPDPPPRQAARRFEREPIDIVAVVDDLLRAGR